MWQLKDRVALLRVAEFSAELDLLRPFDGLRQWRRGSETLPISHLLAVRHHETGPQRSLAPSEVYLRGSDLIATYSATAERNFSLQIYWRILTEDLAAWQVALGMELIVSVQTELLDSQPGLAVTGSLQADEIWQMNGDGPFSRLQPPCAIVGRDHPGVLVFALPRLAGSYVEMVFPSDFAGMELTQESARDSNVGVHSPLFPEHLEKGVIRRGRVRGYWVARDRALEAAVDLYERFRGSAIPLTT